MSKAAPVAYEVQRGSATTAQQCSSSPYHPLLRLFSGANYGKMSNSHALNMLIESMHLYLPVIHIFGWKHLLSE